LKCFFHFFLHISADQHQQELLFFCFPRDPFQYAISIVPAGIEASTSFL